MSPALIIVGALLGATVALVAVLTIYRSARNTDATKRGRWDAIHGEPMGNPSKLEAEAYSKGYAEGLRAVVAVRARKD